MVKYSEDFKERCKRLYPNWRSLHEAVDNDFEIVGRYLDDSCNDGIDFDVILNSNSLEELKT